MFSSKSLISKSLSPMLIYQYHRKTLIVLFVVTICRIQTLGTTKALFYINILRFIFTANVWLHKIFNGLSIILTASVQCFLLLRIDTFKKLSWKLPQVTSVFFVEFAQISSRYLFHFFSNKRPY